MWCALHCADYLAWHYTATNDTILSVLESW